MVIFFTLLSFLSVLLKKISSKEKNADIFLKRVVSACIFQRAVQQIVGSRAADYCEPCSRTAGAVQRNWLSCSAKTVFRPGKWDFSLLSPLSRPVFGVLRKYFIRIVGCEWLFCCRKKWFADRGLSGDYRTMIFRVLSPIICCR